MNTNEPNTGIETIYVIITLEGAHNLHSTRPAQLASVLQNIDQLKSWDHKPFFITFAHHFYNDFVVMPRAWQIGSGTGLPIRSRL